MHLWADKFYPAGLGETSDARTHRSNFIRNGGIAETNKFYPAGAWVKLYKKSQNCRNLYFPLMRLGETSSNAGRGYVSSFSPHAPG